MYYLNTNQKVIECTVSAEGVITNTVGIVVGLAAGYPAAEKAAAEEAAAAAARRVPVDTKLALRPVFWLREDAQAVADAAAAAFSAQASLTVRARIEKLGGLHGRDRFRTARVSDESAARAFADEVVREWRDGGYKGGCQLVYDGCQLEVY